jgi:DinB superfamily
MKNFAVALGLLCMAAAPTLRAQSPSTPQQPQQPPTVTSVLNTLYSVVEQQVVSAAEAMPEEKYGFAPTNGEFKGVRTFAEEVKHIGFANHLFFGPLMGENLDPKNIQAEANGPAELKTKAEIVQYLKDSFALGHKAIATITSENEVTPLAKPVLPFLSTRLAIANIGTFHPMDHYGQMVEYLRMNGIIPPASRPRPPQQQAPASQPKSQD